MSNGWDESAAGWIEHLGADGDFARRFVLDGPMLERARLSGARTALDVGCGEGRFCRMLASLGLQTTGIDPARALVEAARGRHPDGTYQVAAAEQLPFPDRQFDLVVSYLTLLDIPDARSAIAEMARVLRPDGHLLVANVTSFFSAGNPQTWRRGDDGTLSFAMDNYMDERADWVAWKDIRVVNWHRPLSTYMRLLLEAGLVLRHFDEPLPQGGDPAQLALFRRAPAFLVMDWEKP
jgi:SAM-dependent methyltransferase